MTLLKPIPDETVARVVSLLTAYAFDFGVENAKEVVTYWLTHYPDQWVRLAVIEALFQGRYKAISVEHLLKQWTKKQHPMFHFAREFELMVSRKLPKQLGGEHTSIESFEFLAVESEEDEVKISGVMNQISDTTSKLSQMSFSASSSSLGEPDAEQEETRTTTPTTKSPSRSSQRQAPPPIPPFTFPSAIPQQQSRSFQEFIPLPKKNDPSTQLKSVLQELPS